jgi:signal peptidase I
MTSALSARAARKVLPRLIRGLWFAVIPALLAGVTYRYGVPGPKSGVVGALAELAEILRARPTLTLLGLFLTFALLLRYWAPALYGSQAWLARTEKSNKAEAFSWPQLGAWAVSLVLAAVAALVLRQSFFQPYRVLSASMLPTLEPGQELLVNRYAYGFHWPGASALHPRQPARGDLIVFKKDLGPGMPDELVKRVIGLPGDTIVVRAGQVWINGWAVPACDAGRYAYLTSAGFLDARLVVEFLEDRAYLTAFFAAPDYGQNPYEVKPGEVFVLGDNRSNSSDSRFWNEGRGAGLPLGAIGGRFDRRLLGVTRTGEADFSELLKPIGLDVHLAGLDTTDLQQGVAECLKKRPARTQPPPPFSQQHKP